MLEAHYRVGQSAGVSIHLLSDGSALINACGIMIKDNKLDIDKEVLGLSNVEALKKHFPPKTRISLNLFGKGILQKQIARQDTIEPVNFSLILPNGNFDDFYIQHFTSGERSFVSVIRKTDAEKWISLLKELEFFPMMLSLGAFPVQHILAQINSYEGTLIFDGHVINLDEVKAWQSYKYVNGENARFPLKVGTSTIDEKLLLPYAAAFQLALMPDIDPIKADVEGLGKKLSDFLSYRKLKVKGFITLVVFFLLLLVNFIAFSLLNSSNDELAAITSVSARYVSDADALKDQIARKEATLKDLGWDEGANKSAMVDRLAALLPAEILLREISINPIDGAATRIQRTITFDDRKIRVVGSSDKIIAVNEWIARVKTLKWVKNIQMDSYVFNSELGTGQFTLNIGY